MSLNCLSWFEEFDLFGTQFKPIKPQISPSSDFLIISALLFTSSAR